MNKTEILFVIDDDSDALEIAKKQFEAVGFDTKLFEYAVDCFKYLMSGNHANAIVVDFLLNDGDMSAPEFIQSVKEIVPCIICATSSFDDPDVRRMLYEAGATDVKPKDYKLIAKAINSIMARRETIEGSL